ncbi:DinB family protein [bacterium]|nr:DinB family protein [bacterium]MCI0606980.1 DinB family protein [bacterium]
MTFDLNQAIKLLEKTPAILIALCDDLPEPLIRSNEGPGTWSPFDVIGHLIHGEKTDWIPRTKIILEHGESRPFDPFDREAMFVSSEGKSVQALLQEFDHLRRQNLTDLQMLKLAFGDLARTGTHPALGKVTLEQHLASWVVHDLDHINQIFRTIAKHQRENVGPWKPYLSILTERS